MLKKFEAKTPDGQEFYNLLESMDVNVDYGKPPSEKVLPDYLVALEVWMKKHTKLPSEITEALNFETLTKIMTSMKRKNSKLSDLANTERQKIGTFDDWAKEFNESYFSDDNSRRTFAFKKILATGNASQLKEIIRADKFSSDESSFRKQILDRISAIVTKS